MKRLFLLIFMVAFALPAWAVELGEDGLHKADWIRDTFKDLREDLNEANDGGKRLMLIFEQRGCIYCKKMHEEVFVKPDIHKYLTDNFFVVQINLYGETEIVDFDGEELSEKAAARKWGILFTPTMMFMPEQVPEGATAQAAALTAMPGAFGPGTTIDMLTWIAEKRYGLDNGEDFQRYHSRRIRERDDGKTD